MSIQKDWKKYYTSEELDKLIKESILKNAKELAQSIKNESSINNNVEYV